MMNNENGLYFATGLDTEGIKRDAKKMEGIFDDVTKKVEKDGLTISNVFREAALSAAAFFSVQQAQNFVRQIAQVRGEFQKLEVAFKTMLGSQQKATELMNQLVGTAAKTPFDLQGLADGAKQLLAFGMASDKVNEMLVRLGDIAAGLSIPLGDLVYLYGTTMTQGRLFTQDLRQFMGRGIPLADELAKQFGVTKDAVGDLVTAGRVGFPEVEKAIIALTDKGSKFGGLMEEQSKTISGQIANIEDAFASMLNEIGKNNEGTINAVLSATGDIIENYDKIGRAIGVAIVAYGTYKTALMVQAGVTKALAMIEQEAAITKALLGHHANMLTAAQYRQIAVTKLLQAAQARLIATMKSAGAALTNPYVLAAAAVVGLSIAIYKCVTAESELEKAQKRLGESSAKLSEDYRNEKYEIDKLFDALKKTKEGTQEHKEAKDAIISQYGGYLKHLGDEATALNDIALAYQTITNEAWKAAKERQRASLYATEGELRSEREKDDRQIILKSLQEMYRNKAPQVAIDEYNNIIKRIEEGNDYKDESASWVLELMNYDKELAYAVNRMIGSRKTYEENLQLYNQLYGESDSNEQTSEVTVTGKLRNKKYWENLKKEKEEELAALTVAQAKGEKGAKLRKDIEDIDAKLKLYSSKSVGSAKKDNLNTIADNEIETRQIQLDMREKTNEALLAQINLDYDKQIAEINKKEKELQKARGGKLLDSDVALLEAQREKALYDKNKSIKSIQDEELQSMRDYLMEYGTLEQQRLVIAEEYAEKIAKAQTEGEKAALRVQQAQAEKGIQQKAFDKSFDWSAIFQDLQGHTVEYLTSLRDQLQDVLKNGGLDPEQMAIAQEKLRELNGEISRSGGIFDFVGSRQREQNRREQEAKDAKDALTAALGEQGSIEAELNLAKLSGAPTNKILALEKQLADAREKTAKATALAKEKEDGAKRNAAQAVADWFGDAQQFIAEKGIDQLPELLNSIGLGSLGEKAAQGLSGFNNAAGAAADFASGNYIGAALKGINAVKDFGRMFGIGGGNAAEVQATIDRLTDRNEILTRAIEDLTEELEVNRGAMTMQAAQEAMRYQEEKNQNLKEIAQAQAGYHNAHHSWNSYWNGFSQEFVKEFSQRIGRSWSGDIWELTADEMDKLLSDPYAAELIKGTGKGGYGERVYEKLEDYAAEAEAIEEITKQLNETMTGMSFDGFYNSFIDNLMDMEKSAEDIFDDMAEYYQRAMLSRAVGEKMYEDLEKWYDKYAEAAKSGEGLTQAEIDALNREYQNLINEGIKKRDEIAKITGYGDTFKDAESAAARGIENITQDQANALEGIMTAQQIALEQGNAVRIEINTALQSIAPTIGNIAIHTQEMRDIALLSVGHLESISRNTHELYEMNERLGRIERYTQNLE